MKCSRLITKKYTTSFYLGILMLKKQLRPGIHAIYGFVRVADEIVDTFHNYDKQVLLDEFEAETKLAIERGISTNPILNSLQAVINKYNIEWDLFDRFLRSMRMDLSKKEYNRQEYDDYIVGSAEVVGLMCLRVFCDGNDELYNELKPGAMRLGAAFQKVNFLRDLSADNNQLGRTYFPNVDLAQFDINSKSQIEKEIYEDFAEARKAICKLPRSSKLGVYTAYIYFKFLLMKIEKQSPSIIMQKRVRISNFHKLGLLAFSRFRVGFNLI